jgi:hypothetical protein
MLRAMRQHENHRGVPFAIETHEVSWKTGELWIAWAEISDHPTGEQVVHAKSMTNGGYIETFLEEHEAIASARKAAHDAINKYYPKSSQRT